MDVDLEARFDLDVPAADLREHFAADRYRGQRYVHLPDARHGVERGTLVMGESVVRGFPSVPRLLVLEPGLRETFADEVVVEEKLNGYNVRIARVAGETLAVTRSGYVCPYTTWLAADLLPLDDFFADHPDAMLCGELVGPDNPYTQYDYDFTDDATLRVFDVRDRETGLPMPVAERRALCADYDLPQVPAFGRHDVDAAPAVVRETIAALDEREREGVVCKSPDATTQVKYTTSAIHRADLAHAFARPYQYGRDFVFARIMREAFQAAEVSESAADRRERARALGEAILLPAIDAIEAVEAGESLGTDHTVRGDPDAIAALLDQFRDLGLALEVDRDTQEGGERVVDLRKRDEASTDKIEYFLGGGTVDE